MEINHPRTLAEVAASFRRYEDALAANGFATTNIEFRRAGRHGRQSQTWARMPEGWRIVAAHVSDMDE